MEWKSIARIRQRLKREQGTIYKDWGGRTSIALIYPNSYWVGMSNLGFQTIYSLLNQYDRIVCERAFLEEGESLSMESQRPLSDFDILAFSIPYELDYFNVAKILKLAQIPPFSINRDERHPLVLAGGAAVTANPEPLAPLFDGLIIGEGEPALLPALEILAQGARPRHDLLKELSRLPGIYVPQLRPRLVKRIWVEDPDQFPTTSTILTPDAEFGKLYLIEIARGCKWGCRFCLAGFLSRPMRPRSVHHLLTQAKEGLRYKRRIGLVGATISDHPQIEELTLGLRKMGANFSVSSLRIKPLPHTLLHTLAEAKAQAISLAPESASERLRQIINKHLTPDDIEEAVVRAAQSGIKHIKLYFMIGLPTETDEEAGQIARLAQELEGAIERRRARTRLTLNLTPFVPKAGTPFQWLPMERAEVLKRRLTLIYQGVGRRGIKIKSKSIEWSLVQGMLSRGDQRLAQVITQMPHVSFSAWRQALEKTGLDPDYVHRETSLEERLPWSIIDSGVKTQHLCRELERARAGLETPPCPPVNCHECGVCP